MRVKVCNASGKRVNVESDRSNVAEHPAAARRPCWHRHFAGVERGEPHAYVARATLAYQTAQLTSLLGGRGAYILDLRTSLTYRE